MMLFLLKSLLFLPTHLSMAGNHFHRYNIYLIFYFRNLVAMVTVCTDFGQSSMTCGIRDQRSSQRMSGERTEVGLNPSLREVKQTDKTDSFTHFSDLDSAVSSGGLDRILAPPAGQTPNQPKSRSFFQSVTVTKVVKPDGVSSNK